MDQLVVAPGNVTFTCVAEGVSRPNITWFFLHSELGPIQAPSDTFSLNEGPGEREVMSTLTITNSQPVNGGMYSCNASNEVSTETATATLTVHCQSRNQLV